MLKLVVLIGMVAVAIARPQFQQFTFGAQPGPQVAAAPAVPAVNPTNFVNTNNPDGSSVFGFQTLDGQSRSESVGIDGSRRGSYSYIDANGQPVNVYYLADNQGYRTSPTPFPAATAAAPAPVAAAAAPAPQQAAFPQFQFFQPQVPQVAQPQQFAFQTFAQPQQIQHHHQVTTPAPVTVAPTTAAPAVQPVAETHAAQTAQAFNPFVAQPFGLFGLPQFGQPGQFQVQSHSFAGRR